MRMLHISTDVGNYTFTLLMYLKQYCVFHIRVACDDNEEPFQHKGREPCCLTNCGNGERSFLVYNTP